MSRAPITKAGSERLRGELERLLGQRRAAYETADLAVDVEHLDAARVTRRIIEKL